MNVIISGDTSVVEKKSVNKQPKKFFKKTYRSEYEEKIVKAKRVSKTTKGGRQSRA